MKPRIINFANISSQDDLESLQIYVEVLRSVLFDERVQNSSESVFGNMGCDWRIFKRWYAHDPMIGQVVHQKITDAASSIFGEKVKPSYCFLSMYKTGDGICPLHTDRPQCKYTIDLCLAQNTEWPLYVDGTPYMLREGQAVCYSGTDQPHYREKIQPNNFCDLIFFHFVPENFRGSLK